MNKWQNINNLNIEALNKTYVFLCKKPKQTTDSNMVLGSYAHINTQNGEEHAIQIGFSFYNLNDLKKRFSYFQELIPPTL